MLAVGVVDQVLEPTLAEELKVRENGSIAFVRCSNRKMVANKPVTAPNQTELKLGTAEAAGTRGRRSEEDQESRPRGTGILHGIGCAEAHHLPVTTGHGRLHWAAPNAALFGRVGTLKNFVKVQLEVSSLSFTDGLSEAVPDDADMVMVLESHPRFRSLEIDAFKRVSGGVDSRSHSTCSPRWKAEWTYPGLLGPLGLKYNGAQLLAHDNAVPNSLVVN